MEGFEMDLVLIRKNDFQVSGLSSWVGNNG